MGEQINGRDQMMRHASEQIEVAAGLLARHRSADDGCCSCGRPRPCPQETSLTETHRHYTATLSTLRRQVLGEPTQALPIVASSPQAGADRPTPGRSLPWPFRRTA